MPANAESLACPLKRSQKQPCAFKCREGYVLSDPSLSVGTLACTAQGSYTDSTCVRDPSLALKAAQAGDAEQAKGADRDTIAPDTTSAPQGQSSMWVGIAIGAGVCVGVVILIVVVAALSGKRPPQRPVRPQRRV